MGATEGKQEEDSARGNGELMKHDNMSFHHLWKMLTRRKGILIGIFLISIIGAAGLCALLPPIYRMEAYAKFHTPRGITTIKELPAAREVTLIIGHIDGQKRTMIFPKNGAEVTEARIAEVKGSSDMLKFTIEARTVGILPAALQEAMEYVGNIQEIKSSRAKILSEIGEKIERVDEAIEKTERQMKELEKRLSNTKLIAIGFYPFEVNNNLVNLKMERYRLEQERQHYAPIQLIENPFTSSDPVKPKKGMIMAIAAMVSLLCGILAAFIAEYRERWKNR